MYLDSETMDADLQAWKTDFPRAASFIDELVQTTGPAATLDRLETATQMRCPGQALADAVAAQGKSVYVYQFNRAREGADEAGLGSYHGAEIAYVFDTHDSWLPTDEIDADITTVMSKAWTQFATTGVPTSGASEIWPDYATTGQVLQIDETIETAYPRDNNLCNLLSLAGPEDATP